MFRLIYKALKVATSAEHFFKKPEKTKRGEWWHRRDYQRAQIKILEVNSRMSEMKHTG